MGEDKIIAFSASKNSIDLIYDDERFCVVSVDLLHEDKDGECNNNKCNISHKANLESMSSIYNTTISCRYNSICKDFVSDVVEHYRDDNERFETRIIGHFPPDARIKFIERENGKTYLNVEGIIHKKLVPEFMNILKKSDNDLKVSTVLKCKGKQDEETGIYYIEKWELQTTTVLSDTIKEGIEKSHLKVAEKPSDKQITNANEVYLNFSRRSQTDDIFKEIKNKQKKENTIVLGTRELEARLWDCLKKYEYSDGNWRGKRYWIHNILPDSKEVVVYDNQTAELYKIPYKVSKEGDVTVKEEERKKVVEDKNYREVANTESTWIFAKEEYGMGAEVKVDKDKDSVSEKEWGKVNKTALRNKVLEAKNYKDLVNDVYLVVEEGWEDAPSEKLKYPVMEIVGGKAVYNRYGLASALGYAKKDGEDEVVEKVENLYEKLGIDDTENADDKKVDNSAVIIQPVDGEKMRKEWEEKLLKVENECAEWKNKYEEMENKFNESEKTKIELQSKCDSLSDIVNAYKEKEDKEEMNAYLKSFKKSFSGDEYEVMASKIKDMSKEDFIKEVDEKVKDFVRKMSEAEDDCDDEFKEFSFIRAYKPVKSNNNSSSLDEVYKKLTKK